MKLSTVVDPYGHPVCLEHVRMTEWHARSHRLPYGSSQGECAYTPIGDISDTTE